MCIDGVCVAVGGSSDSELQFIIRPRDVTTTEGSRLVLLCAANGHQPLHISWLKDGTLLNTR